MCFNYRSKSQLDYASTYLGVIGADIKISLPIENLTGFALIGKRIKTVCWWLVFTLMALPAWAQDDVSKQAWLSIIFGYQPSDYLYLEVENQPKAQVSGGEEWWNFDATWLVEYYPSQWFDLTGELVTGYTNHTDTENSFELTPRIGLRLHFFSQTLQWSINRKISIAERVPRERFYLATWLRLEQRNFFYSGDLASSHEWRFRVRPEIKVAINNPRLGDDGTFYGRGDVEFLLPLSDDVPERFVNKTRFRLGPGYRINNRTKIEIMFMLDKNRDSTLVDFKEDAFMVDLRLTYLF